MDKKMLTGSGGFGSNNKDEAGVGGGIIYIYAHNLFDGNSSIIEAAGSNATLNP